MIFSIGGAMGLLTMLVAMVLPLLRSPAPILLAYLYALTSTFAYASTIGEAFWTVLRTIIGVIPPTQWAAILTAMASLAAIWVVAMHKIAIRWRVNV
jgi:membrane protein DedA with SNARE-associated domain